MTEIIGIIATVFAVIGVVANNRRFRWCFLVWMVSNALTGLVHVHTGIWSLLLRDVIFFGLAIEGWFRWGKNAPD